MKKIFNLNTSSFEFKKYTIMMLIDTVKYIKEGKDLLNFEQMYKPFAASYPKLRLSCSNSLPITRLPSPPAFETIVLMGACNFANINNEERK